MVIIHLPLYCLLLLLLLLDTGSGLLLLRAGEAPGQLGHGGPAVQRAALDHHP
jgi:hypothetical protein